MITTRGSVPSALPKQGYEQKNVQMFESTETLKRVKDFRSQSVVWFSESCKIFEDRSSPLAQPPRRSSGTNRPYSKLNQDHAWSNKSTGPIQSEYMVGVSYGSCRHRSIWRWHLTIRSVNHELCEDCMVREREDRRGVVSALWYIPTVRAGLGARTLAPT
ncbi:hypothetical protein J6590_029910 [Homalodisca vitripennis]|nr:hypothetical protein J6590_029910 [Homalodisca vitripennis]